MVSPIREEMVDAYLAWSEGTRSGYPTSTSVRAYMASVWQMIIELAAEHDDIGYQAAHLWLIQENHGYMFEETNTDGL